MEYLIAVDLEGVHGVVGEPNRGLGRTVADYPVAVENATLEINAAVNALFDSGATKVLVWDNHGGGGNLDFSNIDSRATQVVPEKGRPRMDFLKEHNITAILCIGYHSKEGTVNGILAHTYNSVDHQYLKVNGKQLGELDFDTCIAGEYGVPVIFVASDDLCILQMRACNPDTVGVVTKYATGRNSAIFRERADVLNDIYDGVKNAVNKDIPLVNMPFPCDFEVRYTRMEMAAWRKETLKEQLADLRYGEDAHILRATLYSIDDLRLFL